MAQYLYNGVLLPEIPADVLAEYPYMFILFGTTKRSLWVSKNEPYYSNDIPGIYVPEGASAFYQVNDEEWVLKNSYTTSNKQPVNPPTLHWSNYNIPKGSADATEIYFYGSNYVDPNAPDEPEEPEVFYKISGARLTEIAEAIRGKTGKADPLTLEQMVTEIEGIEAGGIPENARLYYVGYANSEIALNFTSSATGELQEE